MTAERVVVLAFVVVSAVYGYTAAVTMAGELLPFERGLAVRPGSFPTLLAVAGCIVGVVVLVAPGRPGDAGDDQGREVIQGAWWQGISVPRLFQAAGVLLLMVAYVMSLRPAGFIPSTALFLFSVSALLGERNLRIMIPVALVTAGGIWFLVQEILGIYMRPWPGMF